MKQATVSFPQVIGAQDHHQFGEIREILQRLGIKGIRCKALDTRGYRAIFYIGKWDEDCQKLEAKMLKEVK